MKSLNVELYDAVIEFNVDLAAIALCDACGTITYYWQGVVLQGLTKRLPCMMAPSSRGRYRCNGHLWWPPEQEILLATWHLGGRSAVAAVVDEIVDTWFAKRRGRARRPARAQSI